MNAAPETVPFHDDLFASPVRVEYDWSLRTGRVHLYHFGCVDMTGTIRFFQRIDREVRHIYTYNDSGRDTSYHRPVSGEWYAVQPPAQRAAASPGSGTA